MIRARSSLLKSGQESLSDSNPPLRRLKVTCVNLGSAAPAVPTETLAEGTEQPEVSGEARRPGPTPEALEAAQEAALEAFPEEVRVAARKAFEVLLARIEGKTTTNRSKPAALPPWPIPQHLPQRRPVFEAPSFPEAGLDEDAVRSEWVAAHSTAHEARFLLQPDVLKAYAEAKLTREKWEAEQRGRKPSGDLRHPVPRDRLMRIMQEMTAQHGIAQERALRTIEAIATGDVVRVEYLDLMGERDSSDRVAGRWRHGGTCVPILILQSDLDNEAALRDAKANRSPEQIEADDRAWEEMLSRALSHAPEDQAEPEVPDLPEWPTDRDPTKAEVAALSNAVLRHVRYLERGRQIEAQRERDAEVKSRTAARRAVELADPVGTAAAKKATQLAKAAERQQRWRQRQKAGKDGGA